MNEKSQKPRLGVNIDHVATLRQARHTPYPDLILAAHIAETAGADQITCHLREDRRHIQDEDLLRLRKMVKTKLNLEMAATPEMLQIAIQIKPDIVTLVPEKREELTTEGGLDLFGAKSVLQECVVECKKQDIPVSFFINPDLEDIEKSLELGANAIELHTGQYAEASGQKEVEKELQRIVRSAHLGRKLQLKVFAGHGLHYENIIPLLKVLGSHMNQPRVRGGEGEALSALPMEGATKAPLIEEYNIGHSIISRSVFVGLDQAVKEMKALLATP